MLQFQYMAPWVPSFNACIEAELAAKDYNPLFTLFQYATVDADGFPHNRTLVYRGFLFDNKCNNVLTFCTDKRMAKYPEMLQNDKFEAVFYFEKIKKQFRFRGRARIVDATHNPVLDLTNIQPKHQITNASHDSDSDDEGEDLVISVTSSRLSAPSARDTTPQQTVINYPIISPTLLTKLQTESSAVSISYPNLHELSATEFVPPTKEEWEGEIQRVWTGLSKTLRLSFRRPAPMTVLDEQSQKLVDKISRGVDGKKEESGLTNFAVVAMFIDYVDYYEMEKDRRSIYKKDETHHWSEQEVCP